MNDSEEQQTQRAMVRKKRRKAIGAHALATALCLLILFWVMRLWKADLAIPLRSLEGDVLDVCMMAKGLLDNGWYLHNRFIGMPTGLNLRGYPEGPNIHFLLMKLMSLGISNYAVLLNLYLLITFPLTVLTSLFVFRRFKLSYPSAIVGSLLFAFLPYHFLRGEAHLFLASYYLIPLMVLVILGICGEEPLFRGAKANRHTLLEWTGSKGKTSIAICVLVASGGVYYAFFAGFFLLVAGAFASFHRRSRRQLLASVILSAVLFLAFLANVSPSIMHAYQHGKNVIAAKRFSREAEFYGMRITQLVLPVTGHRIAYLANLKDSYNRWTPLVNENGSASLGAIGSFGFLFLLWWLMFRRPDLDNAEVLSSLAVLNISAVLLATIGGFGSLFAGAISPTIRAYNRISVYIAFFSLFAVVVLLENLALKWAASKTRRSLFYGLLGSILVIGILDQTTPQFVPPYEQLKAEYASDAAFVRRIEASVPDHAMIFQLPYVLYPEHGPVHRMSDYSLLRGYLHSKTLRWSYGTMKGREGAAWQSQVVAKPLSELVETLVFAGFNGIYVDRYGYSDHGAELEAQLSRLLDTKPMVSENQRLVFFNTVEFTRELRERYTAEEWQLKRETALHPQPYT